MERAIAPVWHLCLQRQSTASQACRYISRLKTENASLTKDDSKEAEPMDSSSGHSDPLLKKKGHHPFWEDMKILYGDLLVGKTQRKNYVKRYKEPVTHHDYVLESEEVKRRMTLSPKTPFDVTTALYGPVLDMNLPTKGNLSFDLESLQLADQPETITESTARWEFLGDNVKQLIGKPSKERGVTKKSAVRIKAPKISKKDVEMDQKMYETYTASLYGPVVDKTMKVAMYMESREQYSGPGILGVNRFGRQYVSPVPDLQASPDVMPVESGSLFGPVFREKQSSPPSSAENKKQIASALEIPVSNQEESGASWVTEDEDAMIFGPVLTDPKKLTTPYEKRPGPYLYSDTYLDEDYPSSRLFLAANAINKKAASESPLGEARGTATTTVIFPKITHSNLSEPVVNKSVVGQKSVSDFDDYRVVQLKTEGDLKAVAQSPLMNKLRPNYISSSHELVLPGAIVMKICPDELLGKPLAPEKFPSVTNILDVTMPSANRERLDAWKRRKIAELGVQGFHELQQSIFSDGKGFHTAVESVLRGANVTDVAISKRNEGHWHSLKGVFSDLSDVLCVEEKVRHPFLCYKGVTDCVASLEGQPSVIEWKTSATKNETVDALYDNPIQVAAYLGALNFDENLRSRNVQIPNAAVVVAYSSGEPATVVRFDHNLISSYWTSWLKRLQQYWRLAAMQKSLPQRKFD